MSYNFKFRTNLMGFCYIVFNCSSSGVIVFFLFRVMRGSRLVMKDLCVLPRYCFSCAHVIIK